MRIVEVVPRPPSLRAVQVPSPADFSASTDYLQAIGDLGDVVGRVMVAPDGAVHLANGDVALTRDWLVQSGPLETWSVCRAGDFSRRFEVLGR